MRLSFYLVIVLLITGLAAVTWAGNVGVWVGTQFRPKQCLKIEAGSFKVKRKLCTVTYEILPKNGGFEVNGQLRFNQSFIPDKVSDVELEVLLIDQKWVCAKQLDLRADVIKNHANFSFEVEDTPDQRYVRTYYVIHYR